ncbi:MAG: DUF2914 domain-containing protein [Elusimicrobia bacterium]|nr:DUF2914 domain-containing protein [Elusimicrobiota bacterium]
MKKVFLLIGAIVGFSVWGSAEEMGTEATVAESAAASIEVVTSALGSGVDRETRTVQGEATSFDPSVEVHYLTRVKSETVPTTINHVYSVDGSEVASVPLAVKGSPWTTWSRKTVWPGEWKVELKDESGAVIETKNFSVSKDMAPEPGGITVTPAQPQ